MSRQKKKNNQIKIYKLPLEKIISGVGKSEKYTLETAIACGELVPISSSQLTHKINDYYREHSIHNGTVRDAIINIVVPSASKSKAASVAASYEKIALSGFDFNKKHYVRFCAGSGQIRQNTVTFVWDKMKDYLSESLRCGLSQEDLGERFNVAKWNAYFGLSESGMRFLKTPPRVCIISDYKQIKPPFEIDYIETIETIETEDEQDDGKRKSKVADKSISRHFYDDENMDFPALNSFDGQGLADPEWMRKTASELHYLREHGGYVPSQYIVRAPWVKGLVAAFDFKAYLREYGVTQLRDIYGHEVNIEDIDLLISESQFKMAKVYGEKYGGWQYHVDSMRKYNLRWGVVIANQRQDDDYRALNYQYLQALELEDEDIDALCERTETTLTKMCNGDIQTCYETLVGFSRADVEEEETEPELEDEDDKSDVTLLQQIVEHNPSLLEDEYIQSLIDREVSAKFEGAKIGKILCRGGYNFILSDPVAQAQHVIKAHAVDGNKDIDVKGLIEAHGVYSNYWNSIEPRPDKIVLMRSPLVDSSEITVCNLASSPEMEKWYAHLKSGLILSIKDLNTLALQNCDFDGDRCFSSNDPILIKGAQEHPTPILYPSGKQELDSVTEKNMIAADIRGLNSAVGSLSNKGTALYALRARYEKGTPQYIELSRRIKILSELVGVEIDKIKTGIPPITPSSWTKVRVTIDTKEVNGEFVNSPTCSEEKKEEIKRHNELIPEYKPLFMRHVYPKLNRDIAQYDQAFNNECRFNYGVKLHKLLAMQSEKLSDEQEKTITRYKQYFPAINSPCTMNKICERFEKLSVNLKKHTGARNMLYDFVTPQQLDEEVLSAMGNLVDLFTRQKQFLVRSNNQSEKTNKEIAKASQDQFKALREHIQYSVLELVGGDIQCAYNYLVELCRRKKCGAATVWGIMYELMLHVIPCAPYKQEVVA